MERRGGKEGSNKWGEEEKGGNKVKIDKWIEEGKKKEGNILKEE